MYINIVYSNGITKTFDMSSTPTTRFYITTNSIGVSFIDLGSNTYALISDLIVTGEGINISKIEIWNGDMLVRVMDKVTNYYYREILSDNGLIEGLFHAEFERS